jgi:hypothetical protein
MVCNPSGGIKVAGSTGLGTHCRGRVPLRCTNVQLGIALRRRRPSGRTPDSAGVTRCWHAEQQRHLFADGWNRLGPCGLTPGQTAILLSLNLVFIFFIVILYSPSLQETFRFFIVSVALGISMILHSPCLSVCH